MFIIIIIIIIITIIFLVYFLLLSLVSLFLLTNSNINVTVNVYNQLICILPDHSAEKNRVI